MRHKLGVRSPIAQSAECTTITNEEDPDCVIQAPLNIRTFDFSLTRKGHPWDKDALKSGSSAGLKLSVLIECGAQVENTMAQTFSQVLAALGSKF